LSGFPDTLGETPDTIHLYHQHRMDLSVADRVILYQERIVIPSALWQPILDTLHAAHQGVMSMMARARMSVFWPGITGQIQTLRENCHTYHRMAPSNPKPPPTPSPDPTYPFEMVCADYFKYGGHNYLVGVNRYSGWPDVIQLKRGATPLVAYLRKMFITFGIPTELSSDGGQSLPQRKLRLS
jgi:hypothetical protein